ncbi:competence protein ComGD [Falsibacillus pallidus]|uniref:Competence protein ComGD n=2 Tax=Falsibacillus pallidus TaxID=493781 RepID=A0A370GGT8_9BACI|nr:competence protein ComGD [Falsibacillus pallidus]
MELFPPREADENGFTLIEMMVVLSVFTVIMAAGLTKMERIPSVLEREFFISELKADLYYAQSYAVSRKETVYIKFYSASDQYRAYRIRDNKVLFDKKLPDSVDLLDSNLQSFMISGDGDISKFGTLNFSVYQKVVHMKIFIGKGRFVVQ